MNTERGGDDGERRRDLLRMMEKRLNEPDGGGANLADQACLSWYHFQRVFRRAVGEPPGSLRRRLLLERAAHQLRTGNAPVTSIALDANYRSLEGFSRAFRAAYGMSPTAYRHAARQIRRLPGARAAFTTIPARAGRPAHFLEENETWI